MSLDDLAATLRFLKADMAYLEAYERSIIVRKETGAFISKLESAGASSSSQPVGSSGVSARVQQSVPASSAADVPSSSGHAGVSASDAAATKIEDPALVDKSSI